MGVGFAQMPKDFQSLSASTTKFDMLKNSVSIGADVGMIAGGAMTLTKVGPRWLGPVIMMGSAGVRTLNDLVPGSRSPWK